MTLAQRSGGLNFALSGPVPPIRDRSRIGAVVLRLLVDEWLSGNPSVQSGFTFVSPVPPHNHMKLPVILSCCACALAAPSLVCSQVLMIDFGPTPVSGASLTNSPYHSADTAFTGTFWNQVEKVDIATGSLNWSDGTSATGVSINLGSVVSTTSTTINLATQPATSSALGTTVGGGIYTSPSVGRDAIFSGTAGSTSSTGIQVGGLAAGSYDIYISARNTNATGTTVYSQALYAGVSSSAGNFDFSGYSNKSLNYSSTSSPTTWTEDGVYVKLSISLTSGDYLNIASAGGGQELRGFLNSIQIVSTSAVPEPSTYAFIAGLAGLVGTVYWRRRR